MANLTRNFVAGKMNKTFDERVVPPGEYIDALNVRMGSTENSEVGTLENTKGNLPLTTLMYDGEPLSDEARCIGAFQDGANETIYWFVHDPNFSLGATGKIDMIVSVNVLTSTLTYHVISMNDDSDDNTTLNFNPTYTITGVDKVDDLLFFTDDYNPPRFINVNRSYPNPNGSYIDYNGNPSLFAEALQVVKKPPTSAPTVFPYISPGQEQFMLDRFISFAYRYRYADNEYSATSQWSDIAFSPKTFNYDFDTGLNEGMSNAFNAAYVTYNTGGPLVIGIDLLFKEANSNVIKVIEKLNKAELGLYNDSNETYEFVNSKIFTILPSSEILRLYDNVPRFAKAQTIMGNRLMYGNYVEGYNLIDRDGNPTRFTYQANLISENIGLEFPSSTLSQGYYTFRGIGQFVDDAFIKIDLSGIDLVEGSVFNINLTISHYAFNGDAPFPSQTTENLELSFSYYLDASYSSVYDLITSTSFLNKSGTPSNIKPPFDVPGEPTACDGNTWTDIFNCSIPTNLNSLFKYASGIVDWNNEPIGIQCNPGDTYFKMLLPAMLFIDAYPGATKEVIEYYKVVNTEVSFQKIGNSRSLHSNRGYEVGIVYMDEFNRSTTALVSPNNTASVYCNASELKNSIQVTIPPSQIAPSWASRYKFVIKADEENYDTIYSNIYFQDPNTNSTYFFIEGENPRKVNAGDRLIVKADSNGAKQNCTYVTVLEKEAKQANFISGVGYVPAGTYLKINANNFSAATAADSTINLGTKSACRVTSAAASEGLFPQLQYTIGNTDIPAGSRITMSFKQTRLGPGDGEGSCERRIYTFNKDYIASTNYDNFKDWWDGDNVAATLNCLTCQDVGGGGPPINNVYIPTVGIIGSTTIPTDLATNYYQFFLTAPTSNYWYLMITGTISCVGIGAEDKRKSCVEANIKIVKATTKLNQDLKILGTLQGQALKLADINNILNSLKPKDLINIENLNQAMSLLAAMGAVKVTSQGVSAASGGGAAAASVAGLSLNMPVAGTDFNPNQQRDRNYTNNVINVTAGVIGDENIIVDAVQNALNEIARRGYLTTYAGAIAV